MSLRHRNVDKSSDSEKSNEKHTQQSNVYVNTKNKKLLNIAPINIPLNRRLETIGIIWHTISIPAFFLLFLYLVYLGWISWVIIVFPYFIWWYGFDLHTPTNGKAAYRVREWVRSLIVWEWFVNYFPIRVHTSCSYEPTFSEVLVEDDYQMDDEEDLVNENSTTLVDKVFQYLGLGKRLNMMNKGKYKKITSGPRYIFGYHPHGVISMGVMGTFATNILRNEPFEPPLKFLKFLFHDTSKHKRLFPNIGHIFPLTLTTQFTLPFYRDYLLSLGLTSASATNIRSLINNGDNSVCIVVGGAQELLLNSGVSRTLSYNQEQRQKEGQGPEHPVTTKDGSKPGEIKLVLNKRKGFIKLAIELGNINLVPIFGFGEADIYNILQPKPGSFGDIFQKWLKKHFAFTIPFFSARGVFIYDFGFLPYRNPINVCIGKPIYIPSNLVQEYKQKHPEFGLDADEKQEEKKKEQKEEEPRFKKQPSLSNIFSKRPPPRKKAKVPQELLDRYHKLYVDELKRVFDENKAKFGYENVVLNIVE